MRKAKLPEHPMSERLGYVLKRAQHALRTSIDDQLNPLGLTTAQYNLLSAVAVERGPKKSEKIEKKSPHLSTSFLLVLNPLERVPFDLGVIWLDPPRSAPLLVGRNTYISPSQRWS